MFTIALDGLRPRGNVLEVEVTNLSANRLRDLDRRGVAWRVFHDINVVNIDYKPLDASGWDVLPSGLVGPVTLAPAEVDGRRGTPELNADAKRERRTPEGRWLSGWG